MTIEELRDQSPSMMRAHKITRLKFAAQMVAYGELALRQNKFASGFFERAQNILDEVGEKLTPGWFQSQVDAQIETLEIDLDGANKRLDRFRKDGETNDHAMMRWLTYINLTEFSAIKIHGNLPHEKAYKRAMQ